MRINWPKNCKKKFKFKVNWEGSEIGVCKLQAAAYVDLERRQREQLVCMQECVSVCACVCLSIQVRKLGEEVNNLVGFGFGLPVVLCCVVFAC